MQEFIVFSPLCYETFQTISAHEHIKNIFKSSIHYGPVRNFLYCQPAQFQPKLHIPFDKNGSPWDLYIMTLSRSAFLH